MGKRFALAIALFCSAPLPAAAQFQQSLLAPVNCSGTVATGGTAVTPIAAGVVAHGFFIANVDTTEALWVSLTGTAAAATAGSFALPSGTATTFAGVGSFMTPPNFGTAAAVSVVAATAGHKFTCLLW